MTNPNRKVGIARKSIAVAAAAVASISLAACGSSPDTAPKPSASTNAGQGGGESSTPEGSNGGQTSPSGSSQAQTNPNSIISATDICNTPDVGQALLTLFSESGFSTSSLNCADYQSTGSTVEVQFSDPTNSDTKADDSAVVIVQPDSSGGVSGGIFANGSGASGSQSLPEINGQQAETVYGDGDVVTLIGGTNLDVTVDITDVPNNALYGQAFDSDELSAATGIIQDVESGNPALGA